MVRFSEITITQTIETMILAAAMSETAASLGGRTPPSAWLTGAAQVGQARSPLAALNPRIAEARARSTTRMTHSTK